ncbi:MAG: hypothetical protein AAFZ91_00535 [Pseudomonadota bacterium]
MLARLGLAALMFGAILPASANRPTDHDPIIGPIHCVAVFELMARTEPSWMTQIDAQIARRSWQIKAGASARQGSGDLGTQVNQALAAMSSDARADKQGLTVMASQCVAEAPL